MITNYRTGNIVKLFPSPKSQHLGEKNFEIQILEKDEVAGVYRSGELEFTDEEVEYIVADFDL